ncbi:hypothetical protein HZC09_03630, partial [Candidatus Micrarchaeota archaeon]|nr:hypothetical protein [Candidatus Micrarchaeota archaeon]
DRIQEKTGNEYLLILGGINQVPMPALFVVPSKFVLGVPSDELFVRENLDVKKLPDSQGGTAGEIFLSDSKPLEPSKIIISRIPLDAEETSSRPLAEALSKYSRERKRVIEEPRVLADECGHKDNCFLMKDTKEFLWTALFPPKDDCEEPFCLKSPPFCSETGCRKDDLLSALREADFLSVFEHGSGYGYYYVSKDGKGGTVLKPKEHFPQDFKSPAALVLSYACFGASIDFGYNNRRLTGRDSTALAFLRAGASSYVGTTRQGLAEVNNRLVLPLASEVFRAKKAVTLGEAFGIGKREIRKKAEGENEQLVAAMFVLYGDPTVRVVGASQ